MEYEWDESKRLSNLEKHKIDFREMDRFRWDTANSEFDDYYPEPRWSAVGYIGLTPYYVVYTIRGAKISNHQSTQSDCTRG